jgi:hypothetical protein
MKSAKRNAGGEAADPCVAAFHFRISNFKFRSPCLQKGCQPKPGVVRRNSLKTNGRRTKRVTIFRDAFKRHSQISTRQSFQVEIPVTHSKQTIRVRATRQFFGGSSALLAIECAGLKNPALHRNLDNENNDAGLKNPALRRNLDSENNDAGLKYPTLRRNLHSENNDAGLKNPALH